MSVVFQNNAIKFKLAAAAKIKLWIKQIIELEKMSLGQVNFVFTTDEEIYKANTQFLKHTTYTDIITFDYCEGKIINGDILISIDRVKENALKFKIDLDNELRRVIIHGIFHLCGYNDKTKKEITIMRTKENWALKKYTALQ